LGFPVGFPVRPEFLDVGLLRDFSPKLDRSFLNKRSKFDAEAISGDLSE
jgi:hypothetical protein